jgi:hypothetical protein
MPLQSTGRDARFGQRLGGARRGCQAFDDIPGFGGVRLHRRQHRGFPRTRHTVEPEDPIAAAEDLRDRCLLFGAQVRLLATETSAGGVAEKSVPPLAVEHHLDRLALEIAHLRRGPRPARRAWR